MTVRIESKSGNPKNVIAVINYSSNKDLAWVVDMAFVEVGKGDGNFVVADYEALVRNTKSRIGINPYVPIQVSQDTLESYSKYFNAIFFELELNGDVYRKKFF